MKNLLIVESKNDKFFIEALIKHMNISNLEISDGFICTIDDFECLGGLSSEKLTTTLKALKLKVKKENIAKIGILIDQDDKTVGERLGLVNASMEECFGAGNKLEKVGVFSSIPIDDKQNADLASFFTNVAGKGELETVLKTIKSHPSTYADCLQSWQECLKSQGINKGFGLKDKDFVKFWVQVYVRYDTCSKEEQKQAGRKCDNEASMKKAIWNFDHECLDDLKAFLRLFHTEQMFG